MDIPWRIGHDDIEFAQNFEIKVPDIAVDPLSMKNSLASYCFLLSNFQLLIFFDIMD